MKIANTLWFVALVLCFVSISFADGKPKLTSDEFFNFVSYPSVALSPDGNSVVIGTERADWDRQVSRDDLWLYRDDGKGGSTIQLTQSGHDIDPKWSPDGRWIAFRSERRPPSEKDSDSDDDKSQDKHKDEDKHKDKNDDKGDASQIYLISPSGGEAIPLTRGHEEVHTYSWSSDSRTIYYATRNPWTKTQKDDYKKQWKDVVQYRTAERGDTIFALDVAAALALHQSAPSKEQSDAEKESDLTPGAHAIATMPLRVNDLVTSPDGSKLAFLSSAINQREEKLEDYEIYALDLAHPTPLQLTHNQAQEEKLHWANDSRHIFFSVQVGNVNGPYRDLQPHLYWVESEKLDTEKIDTGKLDSEKTATEKSENEKPGRGTGTVEQWSKDFIGPVEHYTVAADHVLAS
ncbi:MAG: hypothetical protein WBV69_07805, partial [Candidatus Sulfotelmatobacter sp.]